MRRAEESLLNHSIDNPNDVVLLAPFTGPVVPLADVPDPVFAEGMFGDGIGIDPLDNVLVSPCDGTITHLARTHHAVTLRTEEGAEILVHIGIDTVELSGKGFTPKVEQGATVRAGDRADRVRCGLRRATRAEPRLGDRGRERRCLRRHRSRRPRRAEGRLAACWCCARSTARKPRRRAAGVNVLEEARRSLTLAHAGGLHARPAARAREAARGFDAKVEVRYEGSKAPIESVVGLLGLGAGEGATIELVGIGAQAQAGGRSGRRRIAARGARRSRRDAGAREVARAAP